MASARRFGPYCNLQGVHNHHEPEGCGALIPGVWLGGQGVDLSSTGRGNTKAVALRL